MNQLISTPLPDIAGGRLAPSQQATLDWVGMKQISLPLMINDQSIGCFSTEARVQSYVSLDQRNAKGIHMSRLYLSLIEFAESGPLSISRLKSLLEKQLDSHQSMSSRALLHFSFDSLLKRPALLSGNHGWKSYPTDVRATLDKSGVTVELGVQVPYSSTCPCSAALSRQLLQAAFEEDFADSESISKSRVSEWLRTERGSVATPHSQRSYATVWTELDPGAELLPITQLIDSIEDTLQTPVQTAVKREDEQEFARRNGANLMFCEDAARGLKNTLNQQSYITDFWLQVDHRESLHAHDATAFASKGKADGYRPQPQHQCQQ